MPELHVLAGVNGAGKTTFYEASRKPGFMNLDVGFVNTDLLAKMQPGGYTTANFYKAEVLARRMIREYVSQKEDFLIESNLSSQRDYDWLIQMVNAGYDCFLYFLHTQSVEINLYRVEKRVLEGGHFVDPTIIRHRYQMVLTHLRSKLEIFKSALLIDMTEDLPKLVARLSYGLLDFKSPNPPEWVDNVLSLVERRHRK